VDRFFSKLDLRDIKIDPYNTSFSPDAEESEGHDAAEATAAREPAAAGDETETASSFEEFDSAATTSGTPDRQPHVPAWATATDAPARTNGYASDSAEIADVSLAAEVEVAPDVTPERNGGSEVLKVSARSRPSAVAGAIAGVVREVGRAEVQAIGAGATNQAVKAVAIARDYLRETGIEAICLPAFIDVTIENEDRTAIRLVVEPR
jgi:stage V sporulation protein S